MPRRRRRSRETRLLLDSARLLRKPGGGKALLIILLLAALLYGILWLSEQRGRFTPAPTTADPIRIATWNLKKFSERARPDLVAIANLVKTSGFDLVAIQEVQQEGQTVQRLRRQLGEPWRHVISDRTGNNERYAFLYRADKIELLGQPGLVNSAEAAVFDRVPYVGLFRAGQFDFSLVTVHLWYGDANFNARRQRETQALAGLAQRIAASSAEKDIIVLGDFNEFRSGGNLHYFDSIGWRRLIDQPTNLSSTEIYDNILVDPRHTREFTGSVGVIRFDEIHYGNEDKSASDDVSDHRPAYADFATSLSDDD